MARRSSLIGGACGAACPARSRSPRYRWSSAAWRVAKNGRPAGPGWRPPGTGITPAGYPRRHRSSPCGQCSHVYPCRAHRQPRCLPTVIVAPGVGLELFAADAAGADHGLDPVPAVAGVVDQLGRLPDDRHLLDPAVGPGRVAVVAARSQGTYRYPAGAASSAPGFGGRAVRPAAPIRFSSSALPLPPRVAAPGPAGSDERQGHAREQGNQGHDGHDGNDQARPVHGTGPPSRIWRRPPARAVRR